MNMKLIKQNIPLYWIGNEGALNGIHFYDSSYIRVKNEMVHSENSYSCDNRLYSNEIQYSIGGFFIKRKITKK